MKKLQLLLAGCIIVINSYAQQGFTIKASIANAENYTIALFYKVNNKYVFDSTPVRQNGIAIFKGRVDEPILATLSIRRHPDLTIKINGGFIPGPSLQFFLDNEQIKIKGDAATLYASKVKGGKANKEWNKIRKKEGELSTAYWINKRAAYEALGRQDTATYNRMSEYGSTIMGQTEKLHVDFFKKYHGSIVSAYFLNGMLNTYSNEELRTAYNKLKPAVQTSIYGKLVGAKIEVADATSIGRTAIPIAKKDVNGNEITLQTLKGKFVLLDFWGSWCAPCRKGHPHMKELYSKYKSQGFEILGIAAEQRSSLEECKKAWKDAIEKDGITWLQVLNNEDADKFDAVKAYGVSAFPTKILLDKEGKVIARFIGEDDKDLDKKLRELFGN